MLATVETDLLRRIVENTLDYVHVAASGGEILYATPTSERILGVPARELVGRNAFDLIHPEDLDRVRGGALALERGGPGARLPMEVRVRHADGSYRWIEGAGVNFLDDPSVRGLIVACIDVTARRHAVEARLAAEQRFRALVEHSAEITSIGDAEGRIRYVSPSVRPILGYEPAELVGNSALAFTHPDDVPEVEVHFRRLAREPGAVVRCQYRVRSKRGGYRWMDVVASNLLEDPAVRGIVVNEHDVTTQRQLEAEVARTQRLDALGRVTGGIAHDFANVIVAVKSIAELGLRRSDDPTAVRMLMADLVDAGDRALLLIRRLLAFSRGQELRPATIDLNEHVRAIEPMLRRLTGDDVCLALRLGSTRPLIAFDPTQLDQVLLNLVVNARDATPDGGTVTIRTATSGADAILSVADTGVGMSAEVQDRIFEPFFTTKGAGDGSGLGLATVFGIVKQSGGEITVASTPGDGATFTIRIPLLDPDGQ